MEKRGQEWGRDTEGREHRVVEKQEAIERAKLFFSGFGERSP
jgi:hypothetical protein